MLKTAFFTQKRGLNLRVLPYLKPPRGYGEQGNLPFLFMGTWEHLANFLGNKGSKDYYSTNWGTFSISFSGAFKKHYWEQGRFFGIFQATREHRPPWGPQYRD